MLLVGLEQFEDIKTTKKLSIKIFHRPRLTMKHTEKRLEYAQYQTMTAKEWRNVVFSNEKKFNLHSLNGF